VTLWDQFVAAGSADAALLAEARSADAKELAGLGHVAFRIGLSCLGIGAERRASLGRELTKLHEEHVRGTIGELAARYAVAPPRGECTLVIGGGSAAAEPVDVEAELRALLDAGIGPRDAAARLVVKTGKPRRVLYQLALALRSGPPPRDQ